jgi:sterol desaturase/sphingolipid hydroxylase (fatty acid hydroxylase superfamily)
MNFSEIASRIVTPITDLLFSPGSVMSVYALAFALTLSFAFLAFRQKRRRGRVRLQAIGHAILARHIIFHRSTLADLCYLVFGLLTLGVLLGWAVVSASTISDFVEAFLLGHLGAHTPLAAPDFVLGAIMTVLLFLAYELGFFIDHSLKHRIPALWELHKTHHSAEVLTPLTNFRVHPIDSLILANNLALVIGLVGGLAKYAIGKHVEVIALDGKNILMILYIYLAAQLQHSQFWIPLRGVLGRLFMSPAHHQIHHSNNPAHFNRNMGASLAIWDWLFGTLEIPQKEPPRLTFGVADTGRDPHGITSLVLDPVINSVSALLGVKLPLPPVSDEGGKERPAPGLQGPTSSA